MISYIRNNIWKEIILVHAQFSLSHKCQIRGLMNDYNEWYLVFYVLMRSKNF